MNRAGYDYCGVFFATLVDAGVEHLVISPGSRSTPLALSAHATDGLDLIVHHDERSAGFFALGLAKRSRRPVALVCTSGTAAANYLPAVVEAFYAAVPLLVLTADRPPELRGRGAPQTIDQVGIYGSHTRLAIDLPVPDDVPREDAADLAVLAVSAASGPPCGPIHLNWPLRKPLEPDGRLESATAGIASPPESTQRPTEAQLSGLADLAAIERGLIVAGPTEFTAHQCEQLGLFAESLGWPIVADATSQLRTGDHVPSSPVISTGHFLWGSSFARENPPEAVLLVGGVPSSAAYEPWLSATEARVTLLDPDGLNRDPTGSATDRLELDPMAVFNELTPKFRRDLGEWARLWIEADRIAAKRIAEELGSGSLSEPEIARTLGQHLPSGAVLYVSNSMPVRDVDQFLAPRNAPLTVLANRGANGIDGVTSSALGAAAAGEGPVTLLTGDIALIHDASGLLVGAGLGIDLTVVVPNNDGGGIFSYLPVADALPPQTFVDLFHTPHGRDLQRLSEAAGATHTTVVSNSGLSDALAEASGCRGIKIIEVPIVTEPAIAHRRLIENRARSAVDSLLAS
jgi:2-succinyl-5-enolpyruvyl-6-hydroxy-3-cyclohexene-1-carboxylate synthase